MTEKPKGQKTNFHLNRDAAPMTQLLSLGFPYRLLTRHCSAYCVAEVYFRLSTMCNLLRYIHNVRQHPHLTICNQGTQSSSGYTLLTPFEASPRECQVDVAPQLKQGFH